MYQEGEAWLSCCPKELCSMPTILVHVDGLKRHLSTKSIPYHAAVILQYYERMVINVWVGPTRLWAVTWFYNQGRPFKGRLYAKHICGARR